MEDPQNTVMTGSSEGLSTDTHACDLCAQGRPLTRTHIVHHLSQGIPTIITQDQVDLIPNRADFVDRSLANSLASAINGRRPMLFCANTIKDFDEHTHKFKGKFSQKRTYNVYLFGMLPCGSKTCIVMRNAPVFCDIRVSSDGTLSGPVAQSADIPSAIKQRFLENVKSAIHVESARFDEKSKAKPDFKSLEFTRLQPMKGFYTERLNYVRIHFNNRDERRAVINLLRGIGCETANDDLGGDNSHFSKVARELQFSCAGWNRFTNYEYLGPMNNLAHVFVVDAKDFVAQSKDDYTRLTRGNGPLSQALQKDRLLEMQWDIETESSLVNGALPTPGDDYTIICINSVHYWYYEKSAALLKIAVSLMETKLDPRLPLVVVCKDEQSLVRTHIDIMRKMSPDITCAVNGSKFDWPLLRDKMHSYKLLTYFERSVSAFGEPYNPSENNVLKYSFRENVKFKIDAENEYVCECVLVLPGILDTDLLPIFTKMYPRAEVPKRASLNYFLDRNGLPSKEDMDFKRMWKIYHRSMRMRGITECHCGARCGECDNHVRELDYEPSNQEIGCAEFTDQLYPRVDTHCCHCAKRDRNLADVADVLYYCMIDCVRPHQLYQKLAVIPDKREMSNSAFVTLYDSVYKADGMKVVNLIGRYCWDNKYAFSAIRIEKGDHEKEHYPGAYVFPPNRGLHSDRTIKCVEIDANGNVIFINKHGRPIVGLDFNSLYPSLMMTYNYSPDKVIWTAEEAERLIALGYTLQKIKFDYERGAKKGASINEHLVCEGYSVRHNNALTAGAKCARMVKRVTYVDSRKNANIASSLPAKISYVGDPTQDELAAIAAMERPQRSVSYDAVPVRDSLPGESMGVFPSIVKEIFDKRVPIKKEFVWYEELKEEMKKSHLKVITTTNLAGETITISADDVEFNGNKINAKQKALKVFANTFYGASGDNRNPVYELLVAGGITGSGQRNIKFVSAIVKKFGFDVHYGDTDSLYLSPPDKVFAECDAEYHAEMATLAEKFEGVAMDPVVTPEEIEYKRARTAARLVWWEKQVIITKREINIINEIVTDDLLADNGTLFLRMAYEEVGFPTVMCGKKKYFMVAHMKTINFYPEDLMMRGIEIIKQGQAPVSREIGFKIMHEIVSPENEKSIIDIVMDNLRSFHESYHGKTLTPEQVKKFVMYARYKPDKENVPVKSFVARMEAAHQSCEDPITAALYEPPAPGDRFEYVICAKSTDYTLEGKKIPLKKGGLMEFPRVYARAGFSIDVDWYVKSQIARTMARFICGDDMFQPPYVPDINNNDEYKAFDKYCVNSAEKYIIDTYDRMIGFDKGAERACGLKYRAKYRCVDRDSSVELHAKLGKVAPIIEIAGDVAMESWLSDQIRASYKTMPPRIADDAQSFLRLVTDRGLLFKSAHYDGAIMKCVQLLLTRKSALYQEIDRLTPAMDGIIAGRNTRKKKMIMSVRSDADADASAVNEFTAEEERVLARMGKILDDIAIYEPLIARFKANRAALQCARAAKRDDIIAPTSAELRQFSRAIAKPTAPIPEFQW